MARFCRRAFPLTLLFACLGNRCEDDKPIVASDPVLALSDPDLAFSATEGGADPADQTVTLTSESRTPLAWSATSL